MSKIVRAVNSMISNENKITNVIEIDNKFFFLYDNKYKWSIGKYGNNFILRFYPENETLENLLKRIESKYDIKFIDYESSELKTREAEESFRELYLIIKEKSYDADKILDDIIKHDANPFV